MSNLVNRRGAKVRVQRAPALWLEPIPAMLHEMAIADFEAGDVEGFLLRASNEYGLHLVCHNMFLLKERGLYEQALISAYTGTRANNSHWPDSELVWLFDTADRSKLRALGDPLPGPGPFVLYRGVSGNGARRHVRGLAWTSDLDVARWFADRFAGFGDPAVYTATVPESAVYVYLHESEREEHEYVVALPRSVRPVIVERRRPAARKAGRK